MPIVRIASDLVYYAHVPKCAGSAVEDYLIDRFGPLAFLDRKFGHTPRKGSWSQCSPQHVDRHSLEKLFPPGFFTASFAVVRHPAIRMKSAFLFQEKINLLPAGTSFERWLRGLPARLEQQPYLMDNHVRPMDDMVPLEARVFRLEDGLEAIIPWLDELEGTARGPRVFPASNETGQIKRRRHKRRLDRWRHKLFPVRPPVLDERLCQVIHELYPQDYQRFGYGVLDPLEKRPV